MYLIGTEGRLLHFFQSRNKFFVRPKTLITEVRYIDVDSDFHKLAVMLSDDMGEKL